MCNRDSMGNRGSSISSMRDMGSLNSLTCSLGDLVVDIGTGDLGHSMAVLNLNWDILGLGVVHAVLGLDFTASMLDGFSDRVGNSMGSNWSKMNSNWCNLDMGNSHLSNMNRGGGNMSNMNRGSSNMNSEKWGMGNMRMSSKIASISLGISIGFSISFTLGNGVVTISRLITDGVDDFLANLLIFKLLCINSFGFTNIFGSWNTFLCHKNLNISLTVASLNGMERSSTITMIEGISLCLGISCRLWCCTSKGKKTRNCKYLHHVEIV